MCDEKFVLRGPPISGKYLTKSLGVVFYENLKLLQDSSEVALLEVQSKSSITWGEIFNLTVSLANDLNLLGKNGVDNIAIYSENNVKYLIPVIAALYLGLPIVNISHHYLESELLHCLKLTKPKVIFYTETTRKTILTLKEKYLHGEIAMDHFPHMIALESLSYSDRIEKSNLNIQPANCDKENTLALLFSSGTTGLPKAVMLSHKNLISVHNLYLDPNHVLYKMRNYLMVIPFSHVYGFITSFLSLLIGNRVLFMAKFHEETFLRAIDEFKISFLPLVPTLMVILAKSPNLNRYKLSTITDIISASAPISNDILKIVQRRLNNPRITQAYGMTECTLIVTCVPNHAKVKIGTVGKPNPGTFIKIRDSNNLALGPGEIGEICVKCDMTMKGYFENTKATAEMFIGDEWLHTGDLAYYDDDGYIFIVDRLKELIKYKGYQVPPAEIEALLVANPKVAEAAVIGIPDEDAGELPMAFVVKSNSDVTENDIILYIKGLVSHPKQLRGGVKFIDAIPKTASGKILRKQLRLLI